MKIPNVVAKKSKSVILTAINRGTASRKYRNKIEPKEIRNDRRREGAKSMGRICPMRTKLKTEKSVPSTKPLASGFWPSNTNSNPSTTAVASALDPNFFCVLRMASTIYIRAISFFRFNDFHNLAIDHIGASCDSQNKENNRKHAPKTEPAV